MKVGNDKVGVVKAHREPRVGEDNAGQHTKGNEEEAWAEAEGLKPAT